MNLLIDECLSPELKKRAQEREAAELIWHRSVETDEGSIQFLENGE